MGISLKNIENKELNISNMAWSYLLNMGEQSGWKPAGTTKPKGYGLFKKWHRGYDSSEGQRIKANDAKSLSLHLTNAINDELFNIKSAKIIENLQNLIEQSIGKPLGYRILEDMNTDFIKEIIEFLNIGDIEIN